MNEKQRATEFMEHLLCELDVGGSHYSPDLRDSLHDDRKWFESQIEHLLKYRPLPVTRIDE